MEGGGRYGRDKRNFITGQSSLEFSCGVVGSFIGMAIAAALGIL